MEGDSMNFKHKMYILGLAFAMPLGASTDSIPTGLRIEAEGTVMNKSEQTKLFKQLVDNPASLLSTIDFQLEQKLLARKKDLEAKMVEKLGKVRKRKTQKELAAIQRKLDNQYGYVHFNFIAADAYNDLLTKNPDLVRIFQPQHEDAEMKKKPAEAESYQSKAAYADAFNTLMGLAAVGLTYDEYLKLKENYGSKPFFKVLHHAYECIACGLSRLQHPFIAENFENNVLDYVKKNFPDKNKQLVITNFQEGNNFMLFVILNKLVNAGYKNLRLNLVGSDYYAVLNRYEASGQAHSGAVNIQPGTFELKRYDRDALASFWRGMEGKYQASPIATDSTGVYSWLWSIVEATISNNMLAYFKQWFNGLGVQLELHAYNDIDLYLSDAAGKADILLGIDLCSECVGDFNALRRKGLTPKGGAFIEAHSHNPEGKVDNFYFARGVQNKPDMESFEWDLQAEKLKPVAELPGSLDYHLSQANLGSLFN